jgi:hypothetical protein
MTCSFTRFQTNLKALSILYQIIEAARRWQGGDVQIARHYSRGFVGGVA